MAYTTIDDPSAHFQVALHSSANAATITNDGNSDLQPDLIWSKARGATHNNALYDSTRGVTKYLISNATNAESTASSGYDLTSFNTDGFSTGNNQFNTICGGTTYVAWQWKANGGTTATNTTGSLNSVVQANTTAGFSIVTWTGAGGVRTVGHGLGVAPDVIIVKNRSTSTQWGVWHKDLADTDNNLRINSDGVEIDDALWNDTVPTSSVFSISSAAEVSNNSIAYCFAEKQGYSKFGKYVGNGSADGPFVYTGFKPAWVMIKILSGTTEQWSILDTKRNDTKNPLTTELFADSTDADYSGGRVVDFLSNGFKPRLGGAVHNGSGYIYIYMAFAENPFVTSKGAPTTARV